MNGTRPVDHGNTQIAGSAGRIGEPMKPALQSYESVLDHVLGLAAISCEQHSQPQ